MSTTTATGGPATIQPYGGARERAMGRREMFDVAAVLAAFAAASRGGRAGAAPAYAAQDADPTNLLVKLVNHITMGLNGAELALAQSLGYDDYIEHHLNHSLIDDSALDARLAPLTTLTMPIAQLLALPAGQVIGELSEAVILRAVLSNRQLFERMVEFWTDHFNIDIRMAAGSFLKPVDDREVIRPNALATFPALLSASAHSPAMLYYLDNFTSFVGSINENYARELMELHTLGVDGGYTQQDVIEVARCFTGWTIYTQGPQVGNFFFNLAAHDQGQKTVLGNIIPPNGGIQDGLTVLQILADHPSTAQFISGKLCRWLLGYDASESVIASVTATYTSTGGDIRQMIRTALEPNALFEAGPKEKRPFHHMVSALRALPTTIQFTAFLRNLLVGAGHHPYYWSPPDGYPDTLAYWQGLLLPRWNFGASLMSVQIPGVGVNVPAFFAGLTTPDQMVDRIDEAMFGGEMPPFDKATIHEFLVPAPLSEPRQRDAIGLAIASPGYQMY